MRIHVDTPTRIGTEYRIINKKYVNKKKMKSFIKKRTKKIDEWSVVADDKIIDTKVLKDVARSYVVSTMKVEEMDLKDYIDWYQQSIVCIYTKPNSVEKYKQKLYIQYYKDILEMSSVNLKLYPHYISNRENMLAIIDDDTVVWLVRLQLN
jgi:hypothetical protein